MTAELSTLCGGCNGGAVVWLHRSFGDIIGFVLAMHVLLTVVLDLGSSLSLSVVYLSMLFPGITPVVGYLIKVLICCVFVFMNILESSFLGIVSILLLIFVCTPFFLETAVVGGAAVSAPAAWTQVAPEINIGLFVSTVVWVYAGLDKLGGMVGEAKCAKTT